MNRARQGRQSLVTPIDWKPLSLCITSSVFTGCGRQSLVTPIDWKPVDPLDCFTPLRWVANLW